jgi:hypothetical protein
MCDAYLTKLPILGLPCRVPNNVSLQQNDRAELELIVWKELRRNMSVVGSAGLGIVTQAVRIV